MTIVRRRAGLSDRDGWDELDGLGAALDGLGALARFGARADFGAPLSGRGV